VQPHHDNSRRQNQKPFRRGTYTTEEATILINYLQDKLGDQSVSFYPGVSYRHLLKIKGADKRLSCTPPHDVPGADAESVMVKATDSQAQPTADKVNELIHRSQALLADHPINKARVARGLDPANSIWPWSPGYKPSMSTLAELYGITGGVVISAVDLIRGIGIYAGLTPVDVDGATGLYDTNYEGKARAAIEALRGGSDFVFLHIEASDEAGHEGDVDLKIRTIEYLDKRVLGPILKAVAGMDEPVSIALLPDHPTPCRIRTHTSSPVPFIISCPGNDADGISTYSERSATKGSYGLVDTTDFIKLFLANRETTTTLNH